MKTPQKPNSSAREDLSFNQTIFDQAIDPKAKIRDFANVKISAVDVRERAKISKHLQEIKANLTLLKSILIEDKK